VSTNDSGLRDGVTVDLNPGGGAPAEHAAPAIPERPADGASKDVWIDYVVELGADRGFVTGDTEHFDRDGYTVEPGLTRSQLIALADRLGG
jgi:hypothetical protein